MVFVTGLIKDFVKSNTKSTSYFSDYCNRLMIICLAKKVICCQSLFFKGPDMKNPDGDVVENVNAHFSCPICLDIVFEAVECDKCNQLYCNKCTQDLKICAICQAEPFVLQPNYNVRRFTGNLVTDCLNKGMGCDERPTRSNLQTHLPNCPFSLVVACTALGCNAKVKQVELEQHRDKECNYVERECSNRGCHLMLTRPLLPSHLAVCRFANAHCPICLLNCSRLELLYHIIERHYDEFGPKFCSLVEQNALKWKIILFFILLREYYCLVQTGFSFFSYINLFSIIIREYIFTSFQGAHSVIGLRV